MPIPAARGSQRHHEHPAAGLAAHEPVRGRLGWVEQRIAGPHVVGIVDSQVRMLEQVRGLRIDLERIFLIQQVRIEPFAAHLMIVLQTTTRRLESASETFKLPAAGLQQVGLDDGSRFISGSSASPAACRCLRPGTTRPPAARTLRAHSDSPARATR